MIFSLEYEDFENKFEYIEYLERNGLITHGCALCMSEYGVCENAVEKYASEDELFVECRPFSDIEADWFPVSCLGEWYGDEYVDNICPKE